MAPEAKRRLPHSTQSSPSTASSPFVSRHPLLGVGMPSSSSSGTGRVASRVGDLEQQQQRAQGAQTLAPLPHTGSRRASEPAIQAPAAPSPLLARKYSDDADPAAELMRIPGERGTMMPSDAASRMPIGPRTLMDRPCGASQQTNRRQSTPGEHHRGANARPASVEPASGYIAAFQSDVNQRPLPRPVLQRNHHPASSSATPGYYLPPPGYNSNDGSFRTFPPDFPRQGNDWDQRAGTWKQQPSGAWTWTSILDQGILPSLTHTDWSLPQAKQILSSWATLATLLAGTQTTLLGYYRQSQALDNTVVSLVYAAIVLDVWGALLAVTTIICSITLQSPEASTRINYKAGTDGGVALGPLGLPRFASVAASSDPFSSASSRKAAGQAKLRKPLSSRSLCILDRLTYACGLIIPLGGVCELLSLAIFSVNQLKHTSEPHGVPAIFIAMGLCLALTLMSLATGAMAGHRHDRHCERESERAGDGDETCAPGSERAGRRRRGDHGPQRHHEHSTRETDWQSAWRHKHGKRSFPDAMLDEETLHDPFDEEKGLLFNQPGPI